MIGQVVEDLTGKTKGGNVKGGTEIVPGKRGRALKLDGESGYVEIELTPEMIEAERNSFTAELWLQTRADGPEVAVDQAVKRLRGHLIFGGYGPDEHFHGHWSMFLRNGSELDFFTLNVNEHTSGGGRESVVADKMKINDGEWHHLVAVRDEDNKEIRAYIDGKSVGKQDEFKRSLNKAEGGRTKIWLGIHIPGHGEWGEMGTGYFPATIDEIRFWGKAMNEADAMRLMSLAVDPSEKLPPDVGRG